MKIREYEEYLKEMEDRDNRYYHGTSSALNISKEIKPPLETSIIRQQERDYNHDVVYVTSSLGMATNFAIKAVKKFGGTPIIYEVEPDFRTLVNRTGPQYITKFAKIKKVI